MKDKEKRIFLVTNVNWAGCDTKTDITDWFNQSECKDIDEFMDKHQEELFSHALQDQALEWHVREAREGESEA